MFTTGVATRNLARPRTLQALLVLFVALIALPAISPSSPANAQAAEPKIQWLNPHPQTGGEVSDQDDTRGTSFHLVAVVANAPADPGVEFHVAPEDGQGFTLPPTTRVAPDTWELHWTIPDNLADGDYIFTAVLYNNASNPLAAEEVARDQVTAYINQHPPDTDVLNGSPEDPTGETVEIIYPGNGGQFGLHAAIGQPGVGVLEVNFSTGTTFIVAYYTVTPPGTEPAWKVCNDGQNVGTGSGNGPRLIRCTLAKADQLTDVTGVAAVANDTPQPGVCCIYSPEFDDSSDAHRVFPYFQTPAFMTFEPNAVRQANIANCSPVLKARLFDQNGRPIAGANVDVHAQGPSDQLTFETDLTSPPHPNKPPDKEHGKEIGYNCAAARFEGEQGEHNLPLVADKKHVETVASGTTNDGGFTFRMHTDAPGDTQITAWADMDDDDEYCVSEVNWSAAIGWGGTAETPPPAFTGVPPDEQICGGRTLTLTPNEVTNKPGTRQVFVATVLDANGQPVVGAPVTWDVGGVGAISSAEPVTDENGKARATVTSDVPGNQRVTASTECDNNADPGDCADRSVAHWGPKFCDVFGDNSDDDIQGTRGGETICSFGGSDKVNAGSGDDVVFAGRGADVVNGEGGGDRLVGGSGNDALKGGAGGDDLRGKGGADALRGGRGRDTCRGGPGNDSARGCEN